MIRKKIVCIIKIYLFFLLNRFDNALKAYQQYIELIYKKNDKKMIDHNNNILKIAEKILAAKNIQLQFTNIGFSTPKILILNTEIYDMGGHTEIALRFAKAFKDEYHIDFILTALNISSATLAPNKEAKIRAAVHDYFEFPVETCYDEKIINLYSRILSRKYTTVLVNIHMQDVVSCAVLGLLKKHTNINILFFNHASHMYFLGADFADVIIGRIKNNRSITDHLIDKTNLENMLFLDVSNEASKYSTQEISALKHELGIPQDAFITFSGAGANKFGKEYFELIRKILEANLNVYHLFISKLPKLKQRKEIAEIIGKNYDRFIIRDYVVDFDLYIQMADLFIDSFPQGSALTLVDVIKNAKPVIIKINGIEPVKSFEVYLNEDYKYSCITAKEMFEKACELISNKEQYEKVSQEVHSFYKKTYDIGVVKQKYKNLLK